MAASNVRRAMGISGHAAPVLGKRRLAGLGLAALLWCGCAGAAPPRAASLSPQELQIVGRAVQFLQPAPRGGAVAVVYNPDSPDSRLDAEAIAASLGDGLEVLGTNLPAHVVAVSDLAGDGFAFAIAASGAPGPALGAALRSLHLLCVTADFAAVRAGTCTMSITTKPRIEIVLNHAAAAACGVEFAIAFRMMIREI